MSNELQKVQQSGHDLTESEKKEPGTAVKLAKGYKRMRNLVKYGGAAVLGVGAVVIALPLLGTVMIFSLAVGAIAFIATLVYAYNFLKKKAPPEMMEKAAEAVSNAARAAAKEASKDAGSKEHKEPKSDKQKNASGDPFDAAFAGGGSAGSTAGAKADGKPVCKLWDIEGYVYIFSDEPTVQDLINSRTNPAGLLAVTNGTRAVVVTDEKNEAILVRLLDGDAGGKEGWVCRSCVVSTDERLAS